MFHANQALIPLGTLAATGALARSGSDYFSCFKKYDFLLEGDVESMKAPVIFVKRWLMRSDKFQTPSPPMERGTIF